jgi:hypothetical protein
MKFTLHCYALHVSGYDPDPVKNANAHDFHDPFRKQLFSALREQNTNLNYL